MLAGHQWETQVDLALRKAARSVLRCLGVPRQSAPFDVEVALQTVDKCGVQLPPGTPVGWGNFLMLATFFMMREIEAAAALAGHLEINVVTRTVSLKLPVKKADPRAVGCTRSWSCSCRGSELRQDCPDHAGVEQLELLQGKFGFPLPSGPPLFPTTDGEVFTKAENTECLEAVGHNRRRDRQDHGYGPVGWQHRIAVREGSATREPFFGRYGIGGGQRPRAVHSASQSRVRRTRGTVCASLPVTVHKK